MTTSAMARLDAGSAVWRDLAAAEERMSACAVSRWPGQGGQSMLAAHAQKDWLHLATGWQRRLPGWPRPAESLEAPTRCSRRRILGADGVAEAESEKLRRGPPDDDASDS